MQDREHIHIDALEAPAGSDERIADENPTTEEITARLPVATGRTAGVEPGGGVPSSRSGRYAIHAAGSVNLVPARGTTVGEAIAVRSDVDVLSFNGSTRASSRVSEVATSAIREALRNSARRVRTDSTDANGGDHEPPAPFAGHEKFELGRERERHDLEDFLEVEAIQL